MRWNAAEGSNGDAVRTAWEALLDMEKYKNNVEEMDREQSHGFGRQVVFSASSCCAPRRVERSAQGISASKAQGKFHLRRVNEEVLRAVPMVVGKLKDDIRKTRLPMTEEGKQRERQALCVTHVFQIETVGVVQRWTNWNLRQCGRLTY